MTATVALLALGGLVGLIGYVWLVVRAFRAGVGWGLAVLLLGWTWVPLILFAVGHWPAARRPLLVWGIGIVLSGGAYAAALLGLGAQLPSSPSPARPRADDAGIPAETAPDVLPPPRPTALPTPPSWEAVVNELDSEEAASEPIDSWQALVPDPDSFSAPTSIPWEELPGSVGRRVEVDLANGTRVTALLMVVESDRLRIRHDLGGGAVAYWIDRDQVIAVRPRR